MSPRKISLVSIALAIGCVIASTGDGQSLKPDPLPYVAPSRDVDVIHTSLDLDLDLRGQRIAGSVTHTLGALKPQIESIRLNCVGLTIEEVQIGGSPVPFEHPVPGDHGTSWLEAADTRTESTELVVHPTQPLRSGDEFELTIRYHGSPKEGLYFIAPEKGIQEKRHEVWAQGEGEDNRHWIPCFDYPNDKATFDGRFRVEKGMYVLSNGTLVGTRELGDRIEYHWRLATPQVSYLITVAAGDYDVHEESWNDVPLLYVVPPGTPKDKVVRGFGSTADMMEFFSNYIGIDYPFEKYAQVVVQNFIYGGMENTTATVMNNRTLYDEHTETTKTQQGLVAHELAHQWWGDMVTCAEWSHIWLNEGFATYYAALYKEYKQGDDDFRYEMDRRHEDVIRRDNSDARPMVVDFFNRKDKRNSANVYTKGASVLHMLRFLLGDELFNKCIRNYGERFKYGLAETSDLARVIKETSGENLDWFFEQWVYLAGHPELVVSKMWEGETKTLKIHIAQTQKVEGLVPVFRLPMDIEITTAGKTDVHRIVVERAEQDFYFALPERPAMVIVDKGDWTLKTLAFNKSTGELLHQLKNADTMSRVRAARDLGTKSGESRVVEALHGVLIGNEFWGLRRETALALGKIGNEEAQQALTEGLQTEDARVRLACTEALGKRRDSDQVDQILVDVFRNDFAYEVRAQAVTSLVAGRMKSAEKMCLEALRVESDQDVIRNAGLKGLAELEATDAMSKVKPMAGPGNRRTYRHTAMTSYAKLAKTLESDRQRREAASFLAGMLDDWYVHTRRSAIAALKTLGDESVVDDLKRASATDPVAYLRARARSAATSIEASSEELADNKKLRAEIKELSEQIELLNSDLKGLQAKLPASGPESDSRTVSRKDEASP